MKLLEAVTRTRRDQERDAGSIAPGCWNEITAGGAEFKKEEGLAL
jgi:hypothetical protein